MNKKNFFEKIEEDKRIPANEYADEILKDLKDIVDDLDVEEIKEKLVTGGLGAVPDKYLKNGGLSKNNTGVNENKIESSEKLVDIETAIGIPFEEIKKYIPLAPDKIQEGEIEYLKKMYEDEKARMERVESIDDEIDI